MEDFNRRDSLVPARVRRERRPCSDGGRLTLAQRVANVWEGLHAAGAAACLVCGGRMELEERRGRCRECGTTLS
jgi:hypothetical protein